MLTMLARRKYVKQVYDLVSALLVLYPKGTASIPIDYPGTKSAIESNFAAGLTPFRSSIYVVATITADVISGVDPNQKALMLDQVRRLDWEFMRYFLSEFLHGRKVALPDEVFFGTVMIGSVLLVASNMRNSGDIDQGDYDLLVSEVSGSLSGLSSAQRSQGRMTDAMRRLDHNS